MRRIYDALIALYPRGFRDRVGEELRDVFRREYGARRGWDRVRYGVAQMYDAVLNLPGCWMAERAGRDAVNRRRDGGPGMGGWTGDIVQSGRGLVRTPGFALVVVATLAIGIGANTAMYGVVDAVLLRPFAYPDADRLVVMWESYQEDQSKSLSYLNWRDWRDRNTTFEGIGAHAGWAFTLTGTGSAAALDARVVSSELLDVLGITPALGRGLLPEDEEREARVVLLSHALWVERFGADPEVVGRAIILDGEPHEVVGVLPPRLDPPLRGADLLSPITAIGEADLMRRSSHPGIVGFGRLRPGASLEGATRDMDRVTGELAGEYPDTNRFAGANLVSFREQYLGSARTTIRVLGAASVLLLLLVCANVANLMLARGAGRAREAAVRTALGATRRRLVRLYLFEAAWIALAGGVVGFGLGVGGLRLVEAAQLAGLPRLENLEVSWSLLAVSLLIGGATALLRGLLPALQASVASPSRSIREGARGASPSGRSLLRRGLVVSEVAFSTVLLVSAGLMTRSIGNLFDQDLGFDPESVLVARAPVSPDAYPTVEARAAFYRDLLDRVRALPGVIDAASVDPVPLGYANRQNLLSGIGLPTVDDREGLRVDVYRTSPGYFRTMGTDLLAGVPFDGSESTGDFRVVIDERLAERLWPGEAPDALLGRTLRFAREGADEMRVGGVARHVRHYGQRAEGRGQLYLPYTTSVFGQHIVVRTLGEPLDLTPSVRSALARLDRQVPLTDVRTMEGMLRERVATERLTRVALLVLGAVALGLSVLGLYAVISFHALRRSREMGIRMALGAARTRVVGYVLREAVALSVAGVLAGLVASLGAGRVLATLLFGVGAVDPATMMVVALIIGALGVLSSSIPAWGVTAIDPARTLTGE